jgi:hypothetical protein
VTERALGDQDHDKLLSIWSVYDHPSDFPNLFVARRWLITPLPVATKDIIVAANLNELRLMLERAGLVQLMRSPQDDPKIVETWI